VGGGYPSSVSLSDMLYESGVVIVPPVDRGVNICLLDLGRCYSPSVIGSLEGVQ